MRKIIGFEQTDFAYVGDEVVWLGENPYTSHPRVLGAAKVPPLPPQSVSPLSPASPTLRQQRAASARMCLAQQMAAEDAKGLMRWLTHRAMAFPLANAKDRFDAVHTALVSRDLLAFEAAAMRVLGLGLGLTPSGDDFLGGIFFVLAHQPQEAWQQSMPRVQANLLKACETLTNPISAALLRDNIQGASYGVLHEMLDALTVSQAPCMASATRRLLALGASSGADLLAGLLLALTVLEEG